MQRLAVLLLITLLISPTVTMANDISANSKLIKATVYADRAKITRRSVIDVPAGAHVIILKDVPAGFMPDTLRAEGSSKTQVKFGAVAHRQVMSATLTAPREKELTDKIQVLQDQRRLIEDEKQALEAKKTFLTSLGQQATVQVNKKIAENDINPEQWLIAAQTVYQGMNDILVQHAQLDITLRSIDAQIQKIQKEVSELSTGNTSTFEVIIPVDIAAATELTVDVSYQVPNAAWRPIYDARLNTESGKLELIQYGSVRQSTGEDWSKVALILSTAQPQRGATLPDLQPLWVDLIDNDVSQQVSSSSTAFGGYSGSSDLNKQASVISSPKLPYLDMDMWRGEAEIRRVEKATFVPAEIVSGGFSNEYKIPGPASVPADGTETKLMVGSFTAENKIQVQVNPQSSAEAYLVAQATLKGDSPVMPGQISLFRDDAYVGQSALPLWRPGEEFGMFFGVDDKVSVKRKTIKNEKNETGIIARDNTLERQFVTELQNLHKTPVTVVVKETIPSGRDNKLSTEILKPVTTTGYEQDATNIKGLLTWRMEMAPKEKKDVKLGWKLTWPKDYRLSGV